MTTLGFRIVPVVARVEPGFALTLNPRRSTKPSRCRCLPDGSGQHAAPSRDWQGMTRHYYAMTFGERYIWGVTAGILRNLYERIYRMIRPVFTEIALFLTPFVLYAVFLWATRAGVLDRQVLAADARR